VPLSPDEALLHRGGPGRVADVHGSIVVEKTLMGLSGRSDRGICARSFLSEAESREYGCTAGWSRPAYSGDIRADAGS